MGPLSGEDKLPRDALPGRIITGKVQLAKSSENAGAKEAPGFIPLTFMCALISMFGIFRVKKLFCMPTGRYQF